MSTPHSAGNRGRTLELEGVTFQHIAELLPDSDPTGRIDRYTAHDKYRNSNGLVLNPEGLGPFCRLRVRHAPKAPGVFALVLEGRVVFLSNTDDLYHTVNLELGLIAPRACYERGDENACRVNNRVLFASEEGSSVSLWFHLSSAGSIVLRRILADMANAGSHPIWNPPLTVITEGGGSGEERLARARLRLEAGDEASAGS
ncbi:MAG: hypothetical protein KIS66_10850 [Fimbriimonadaceae bacterium]|nr:hypothetical protein [Fimbriimonadaceae bacterium]